MFLIFYLNANEREVNCKLKSVSNHLNFLNENSCVFVVYFIFHILTIPACLTFPGFQRKYEPLH